MVLLYRVCSQSSKLCEQETGKRNKTIIQIYINGRDILFLEFKQARNTTEKICALAFYICGRIWRRIKAPYPLFSFFTKKSPK